MIQTTQSQPIIRRTGGAQALFLLLRAFLTMTIPVLLVLLNARLLMTPLFLEFEYNRAGFPRDFYGLTRAERLQYGPLALEYLLTDADLNFLARQTFPSGQPLYNQRELYHMRDVKVVTRGTFTVGLVLGGLALVAVAGLAATPAGRRQLSRVLLQGGQLTIAILLTIVLGAVFAWDFFFTGFHNLFFAEGTWQFYYSDTLIRLFPEQLWFDAAVLIGVLTVLEAVVLVVAGWRWGVRQNLKKTPLTPA